MHLLLIRHGETDWNNEGRIQGHTDTPLNARGIEQAQQLAARVAAEERIDVLYTSPLARARVTAETIAQKLGAVPIPDERLMERYFGDLEGLDVSEIEQCFPDLLRMWRESKVHVPLPGEETNADFHRRVQAFLDDLRTRHSDDDTHIAIVTHGGTINMLLTTLIGLDVNKRWPFWLDNASLSLVHVTPTRSRIHLLNDTCHLRNGREID
jgi:probable phosphoglycerate mutase